MAKANGTDLKPATPEQHAILTGEIALAVAKAKPSFALMQRLTTNKVAKRRALSVALKALEMELVPDPRLVAEQEFWAKLGVALAIDDLNIPDCPEGFTEIAIKPAGVTNEQLFALIIQERKKRGESVWKYYDNLDDVKEEQSRPSGDYVFAYRPSMEPDTEHLGKSYDVAIASNLTFLTLSERLIAELRAIVLGKHLDAKGVTITSSLASGGRAFVVYWNPSNRKSRMGGRDRSDTDPVDGPRQAVFA